MLLPNLPLSRSYVPPSPPPAEFLHFSLTNATNDSELHIKRPSLCLKILVSEPLQQNTPQCRAQQLPTTLLHGNPSPHHQNLQPARHHLPTCKPPGTTPTSAPATSSKSSKSVPRSPTCNCICTAPSKRRTKPRSTMCTPEP